MSKSKKITCVITGKSITISGDYLTKKIEEYGSEAALDKLYVCKEARGLLKKGYSVLDTRKLLDVPADEELPPKEVIEIIEKEYQRSAIATVKDVSVNVIANATAFTYNKSDKDVEDFVNEHIIGKTKT